MNMLEYEKNQEIKLHGNTAFPFNIYLCSIPLDFSAVPDHWHNDMEIIYIKKGSGIIRIDLISYHVSAGDIVLVCPGQLHSILQKADCTMEYENIIFQLEILITRQNDVCNEKYFLPLKQNKIILPHLIQRTEKNYRALSSHLDCIDELLKTDHPDNPLGVKGELYLFFHSLFTSHEKILPRVKENKSLDRLKTILKYVETNYADKMTIESIASATGFSKSHFMKFFKQNMGSSFIDYLNDYRLTMAARLLISSSADVIHVAGETGFDNVSYFNRLFKRKYDCTPMEFREQKY